MARPSALPGIVAGEFKESRGLAGRRSLAAADAV
jgi:hypothetical protein